MNLILVTSELFCCCWLRHTVKLAESELQNRLFSWIKRALCRLVFQNEVCRKLVAEMRSSKCFLLSLLMFSSTEDVSLREEICLAGSDAGYMKNEFVLWHCIPLGTLIQGSASYFIKSWILAWNLSVPPRCCIFGTAKLLVMLAHLTCK